MQLTLIRVSKHVQTAKQSFTKLTRKRITYMYVHPLNIQATMLFIVTSATKGWGYHHP